MPFLEIKQLSVRYGERRVLDGVDLTVDSGETVAESGAILTHLRVGDAFFIQVLLGVLVCLGIYLREGRLKAVLPLRQSS